MARAIILLVGISLASTARPAPSIVSINLCTDQLVLNIASPEQILSLSWLAMDPDESMMAERASAYPPNYGTAEEVIRFAPDIVIAGRYTNIYTKALLSRLGFQVIEFDTARSIEDVEENLLHLGVTIQRASVAQHVVEEMRQRVRSYSESVPGRIDAAVVRPGGFTIEANSLARELLMLAGINDLPSQMNLDEWGSLSIETLLRANPEALIVAEYKSGAASLANAWLRHPAILNMSRDRPTAKLPVRYWACGIPQSLDSVDTLRRLTSSAG